MGNVIRFSLSIESSLFRQLQAAIRESGYRNRSEFIRGLLRKHLVEEQWRRDEEVLGTITLVYNHDQHHLSEKLTHLQHDFIGIILVSTHVHLDAEICAEVILVKGRATDIRRAAARLRQQKGVLHASLSLSSTGRKLR